MRKEILLSILFIVATSLQLKAQIYGNTDAPDYGGYAPNAVVWLKIVTGPSDSGTFTHFGLYNHPTSGSDCAVKFAIYSDHPTADQPQHVLVTGFDPSPTNGAHNEFAISSPLPMAASTTYWIAVRVNCTYGSGREASVLWSPQPLKFYGSWSYFSSWPDPVNSPSTSGAQPNMSLWLVGNGQVLPVELLDFEVKNVDNDGMLQWTVASEINNAGWNIQRSENGFSFETIGFVKGQTNSSIITTYNYRDTYDGGGLVFYRLEQVDLDGTKTYSEVKNVWYSHNNVSIYPTQAEAYINIKGLEEPAEYQVISGIGEMVGSGIIEEDDQIDISALNNGINFIYIGREYLKFIKI